jgi:hypothetical protein
MSVSIVNAVQMCFDHYRLKTRNEQVGAGFEQVKIDKKWEGLMFSL